MTEKLYYEDMYKSEFEALVVDVTEEKKRWRLVLDKTCFYPEGGGQPADKGWINNIPVLDVQKQGDIIYHYLAENPGRGRVKGNIDIEWRKDFMQQHTGQHIISGALWKVGKYKTVSVHMGIDYTTIEIDAPDIPGKDLIETEKLANQAVSGDLPLSFIYTDHQELDRYPLRKPCTREGQIRLVKIGDYDCVACGGLHFDSTRKVKLVKATGIETIRGHARITWKIGDRALADYSKKDKIISDLRSVLATREDNFAPKAAGLQEELITYKRRCSWFENRLADMTARDFLNEARQNRLDSSLTIITRAFKEEDEQLIKKIIKSLLTEDGVLFCFVNALADKDKLRWSIGCSQDVKFPFDKLKDELLPVIGGKGGGRPPLWQGAGAKPGGVNDFLSRFRSLVMDL
jgi:alanyl-tRNA synthetase